MPVAPDLCGVVLDGRYELDELIGEGAFGRVYRGRDERLDRPVAVKVIKPWWGEDPAWAAVFARETRLLARMSDPGIVQIHDVGHADEGLFYVSELVEGENLAQRLARTAPAPLPVGQAREIALGLCRALAGAHREGIVHRDVKPANVLLPRDRVAGEVRVKVADFGVARLAESTTAEGSLVVGTPKYMAPEQGSAAAVTPATDVYSVGVILHEMLAGTAPFTGDSALALALGHLHDAPPTLPEAVGRELRRVVSRALDKDPARRYPDAGAMAAALTAVKPSESDSAAQPVGLDRTRVTPPRGALRIFDPAQRRRNLAGLALVGALLGALIVGGLLSGGTRSGASRRAPAPVEVPLVVRESLADVRRQLSALHLRTATRTVPAPGIAPGIVVSQVPLAGHSAAAHSLVHLSVAEVPRWRTVTTFSSRSSVAFRIQGARWRILASATGTRACTLLVFCHHTHVAVLGGAGGDTGLASVELGDGIDTPHVFALGVGRYRVSVDPAGRDTHWSIRVQDDY